MDNLTILDPNTHREIPVSALAMCGTEYQAKALVAHFEINFAPGNEEVLAGFERVTQALLEAQNSALIAKIELAAQRFEEEAAAKPNDDRAARRASTAKAILTMVKGAEEVS